MCLRLYPRGGKYEREENLAFSDPKKLKQPSSMYRVVAVPDSASQKKKRGKGETLGTWNTLSS